MGSLHSSGVAPFVAQGEETRSPRIVAHDVGTHEFRLHRTAI